MGRKFKERRVKEENEQKIAYILCCCKIWRSHSALTNNMPLFLRLCPYPLQHKKSPFLCSPQPVSKWSKNHNNKFPVAAYCHHLQIVVLAEVPEDGSSKLLSHMKYWNKDKNPLWCDRMWLCIAAERCWHMVSLTELRKQPMNLALAYVVDLVRICTL
jgi:hypothetical protein